MNDTELNNVSKIYPVGNDSVTALSDISMSIKSGESLYQKKQNAVSKEI